MDLEPSASACIVHFWRISGKVETGRIIRGLTDVSEEPVSSSARRNSPAGDVLITTVAGYLGSRPPADTLEVALTRAYDAAAKIG